MRFLNFLIAVFFFTLNPQQFFSINKSVCDSAYAGQNQQACSDSVLLKGNVPVSGTGFWSCTTPGVLIFNPGSDSTLVTGLSVGQNVFVWTITGSGGCPTISDTVIYFVDSIPTKPSAGFDQQFCGNSTTLTGNQPLVGTGLWVVFSGSGTFSNPNSTNTSLSNLGPGQNIIRWTISAGSCVRYDEVVITADNPPSVSVAGPDQIICDTFFLMAANNPTSGSGLWSLIQGVGKIFKPNFSNTSVDSTFYGDTLVFVWTVSSGVCQPSSDTVSVIINIPPSPASAGNDQIICSQNTVLSAGAVQVGTGVWNQISGSSVIADTLSPSSAVSSVSPGSNVFTWIITNGVCRENADTVIINNQENDTAYAGQDQNLCALSSVLSADSIDFGTGTWSLVSGAGSILQPNSNQSIVSNLNVGQNMFLWVVSNGVCPSKKDTVIITVFAPPAPAFAGQDEVVCGNSVLLSGSGVVNGVGTWSLLSGSGLFSQPNSANTLVTGLSPGQNVFAWTIVNGVCPPSSDTISVVSLFGSQNAFAGSDTTICSDSIQLFASAPLAGTGVWTIFNQGPLLSSTSILNPVASNLVVGQNIFIWTVSNAGNCPSFSDSVIVTRDEKPTVANAGQDINTGDVEITLSANQPLIGTGIWSLNGASSGNILSLTTPNSIFSVSQSGEYSLVWTISNGVCPSSSDTINISVRFEQIPEVITPNNDGKNDVFKINPLLFSDNVDLYIYNRWGNLVYESKDYQHDFSGKSNSGADLADDSYFYEVYLNGLIKFKGYLLIKRK